MQKPIHIFCCYARKDQPLLLELKTHLMPLQREGLITLWADIDIDAGTEREKEIHAHLNAARIILLLISPDFLASEYCYSVELRRAMERHEQGESCVIPIILRPVSWQKTPFSKLQTLPKNAHPITSREWHNQDEAFYNVAEGIRDTIDTLEKMNPPISSSNRSSITEYSINALKPIHSSTVVTGNHNILQHGIYNFNISNAKETKES